MLTFNSLHFIAFLGVVVAGFALLRRGVLARNGFLLLASWYFYWQVSGDVRWLGLLLGTQVFDYTFARIIERYPLHSAGRKWCVVGSCTVNLAVLGFFKYCNFFLDNVVSAGRYFGYHLHEPTLRIMMPAGISFYTFQSMSYVIDVYRGHLKAEKHPLHYALFVAFFPQLVAGPIERATHLLPQIKSETPLKWDNVCHGAWLIGLGLFKKVVLADNISKVANVVFDTGDVRLRPWESAIGVYAFALQIYFDFSAYSDIARGAARLMGFGLMRNFDLPYFAVNPSDFWRRWHISLSSWLRDYLYIPLGGNRGGSVATYRNLFLTMLLGGLWHGANWMFIGWGAYHGLLLCGHRLVTPLLKRYAAFQGRASSAVWTAVRIAVFLQFTMFGWLLFRCGTAGKGKTLLTFDRVLGGFYAGDATGKPLVTPDHLLTFGVVGLLLVGAELVKYLADDHDVIFRVPVPLRAMIYAGMIWAFLVFGDFTGDTFIYFQF